jgi:hypothetical protein
VFVAAVAFAPSQAQATCGDYVTVGGQQGHKPIAEHQRRPGCHGPECSNRSFPPATPASRVEVAVERWAIADDSMLCESPRVGSLVSDAPELLRDGIGLSILRPPK